MAAQQLTTDPGNSPKKAASRTAAVAGDLRPGLEGLRVTTTNPASANPSREESSSISRLSRGSWRAIFFAPLGDGQRRRRGSDAVRLILAVVGIVGAIAVLRSDSYAEDVVTHALSPPPYGVRWLVDVFWIGGSYGTIVFLLLVAAFARRWTVLRDLQRRRSERSLSAEF